MVGQSNVFCQQTQRAFVQGECRPRLRDSVKWCDVVVWETLRQRPFFLFSLIINICFILRVKAETPDCAPPQGVNCSAPHAHRVTERGSLTHTHLVIHTHPHTLINTQL